MVSTGVSDGAELGTGDLAPGFELTDQGGESHRLGDYKGKWLVVYFYPKNDTPGCTTEACAFRDDFLVLKSLGVQLLGLSVDDTRSHARFAEKYGLPFPLLSDPEGDTARAYGSLFSIWPLKFAKRHTFVIDPDGRIAKVYRKVKPGEHSDQVIADVRALQAEG